MAASTVLPVIIRRRPPEVAAGRAKAVLHAALHELPAGLPERSAIVAEAGRLDEALDELGALERGDVHWEAAYPWLSAEQDPHAEALAMAASEAEDRARALITVIAACCGTEIADRIAAITGGTTGGQGNE